MPACIISIVASYERAWYTGSNDGENDYSGKKGMIGMLSGKQKRHLRGLGHNLKPVILVGKGEINDALISESTEALAFHELIKVKVLESCMVDRNEVAAALATACEAEVAQVLGRTILLYKRSDEAKIELPR